MTNVSERDAPFEGLQQELERIGAADIVLGLPTYNHHETVARAVEAGVRAAAEVFPGRRVVMVNADGGSHDDTAEQLRQLAGDRMPLLQVGYPIFPVNRFSQPLAGVPGRREAALEIFRAARKLGAGACVLLDAEVESITPAWVEGLVRPALDGGADLVLASYRRQKFDGLINTAILSPFMRALYGKRLRQPVGADLGISAALMDFHLERSAGDAHRETALDPWSMVPAVCHGFRIGECFLGERVVTPRGVPPDLSDTLRRVLGQMFEHMERTAAHWQKVRGSEVVPGFGLAAEVDAGGADFDRKPMIESFRQGCHDLMEIWRLFLPPATLLDLRRMERIPGDGLRFSDELWARIVYDFALGYHGRVMGRDHLLQAITPLYLGWAASFTGEMCDAGAVEVDARVERLCLQFEAQKKYLISRWRWPDRFNP